MRIPWNHRPNWEPMYDGDEPEESWEDNWLSNSMAWFSETFMPNWCQSPDHWTVKIVLYLWADCSCCLSWRFFSLGAIFGVVTGTAVVLTVI
jgi:hypothetical protein